MANIGPIVPHLWFDTQAPEAAKFYTELFPDSKIDHVGQIRDTPGGDCTIVDFTLAGQRFMGISAGPAFKANPSISFILNFDPSTNKNAKQDLDTTWARLIDGGIIRMELDEYPFSKHYGWVEDRFGMNWQLMLTDPEGEPRPFIIPALMYTQHNAGQAERAIDHYTNVLPDSKRGITVHYGPDQEPDKEGSLMFGDFQLCGQWFAAMDSAHAHDFVFNEAVSLLIECDTQNDINTITDALSADPEAEQCGWLKDRWGVSWQVTPREFLDMLRTGTDDEVDRLTQAFLQMKRFDIEKLKRVLAGEEEVAKT